MKIFSPDMLSMFDRYKSKPNINKYKINPNKSNKVTKLFTFLSKGAIISGLTALATFIVTQTYNKYDQQQALHWNQNLWQIKKNALYQARILIAQKLILSKYQNPCLPLIFYIKRLENLNYHMKNRQQTHPLILHRQQKSRIKSFLFKTDIIQTKKYINKWGDLIVQQKEAKFEILGYRFMQKKKQKIISRLRKYKIRQKVLFGIIQNKLSSVDFVEGFSQLQKIIKFFNKNVDQPQINKYRNQIITLQNQIMQMYQKSQIQNQR